MAAYNSFIHRLVTIPMEAIDFHRELNIIKYIATHNGYKSSLIDWLLIKHYNKLKYRYGEPYMTSMF